MIEARALVSINFLNLSENYDFMSRWLGVYDKYAKLLKGSSDVVVLPLPRRLPRMCNVLPAGMKMPVLILTRVMLWLEESKA